MTNCEIKFQENRSTFFAGETVKGSVDLILEHPKKFRGLFILIHGMAKVHWTERKVRVKTFPLTVHFEGKQVFLNTKKYLFGHEGATPPTVLNQGVHEFKFKFQLPKTLPASVKLKYGQILYFLEVVLDIPWRFDREIKFLFRVKRSDDLNLLPNLNKTFVTTETRSETVFWFKKMDQLKMTVSVPKTGYGLREKISVFISFNNQTSIEVIETTISFIRIFKYFCTSPYQKKKSEVKVVSQKHGAGVRGHSTQAYEVSIESYVDLSSNTHVSQIVQVSYEILVEARLSGFWKNLRTAIPITFGTIPISAGDNAESQSSDFRYSNYLLDPLTEDRSPNRNPPSYDEVMRMDAVQNLTEENQK